MSPQQLHARLAGFASSAQERRILGDIEAALAPLAHDTRVQFWLSANAASGGQPPLEAIARAEFEKVLCAAADFSRTFADAETK